MAADPDRMLELYYRVSYRNQNTDLPASTADYLKVIALPLVIDRYKLPGLNAEATDIADDMAYGYGVKHEGPIYSEAEITAYLSRYTQNGWDAEHDFVFANSTFSEETVVHSTPLNNNPASALPNKSKYSLTELLSHRKSLMEITAKLSTSSLETDFRLLKSIMVWGSLSPVLDAMMDKFCRKEGGVFEDVALTESVRNNPSTRRYCDLVEDYIAEYLKTTEGRLVGIENREPDYGDKDRLIQLRESKRFRTPLYPYDREWNLPTGRTLALNDIWATTVILKNYKKKENANYEATYEVTLWDHFGIDPPDMDKFFSTSAGFRAWFILQHLHGYKPFLTKIAFEHTYQGNLNTGRDQRIKERSEAEEQEERLRQMGRRRPGEY